MKAIIIAAGMGNRLLHMTMDKPKCKLSVRGKPLIEHQLAIYRGLGITDISIIKGFFKEQINYEGTKSYYNDDYQNNNILASLFYAEDELNDDVIVAYSDILFEKSAVEALLRAPGDIAVVVDVAWKDAYGEGIDHSIEEAEKVTFHGARVSKIGKPIPVAESGGEFIGLAKFTKKGTDLLRHTYHEMSHICGTGPFQTATSFKNAYLVDILQELCDGGHAVHVVPIEGGWHEIDTIADLKRAGGEITSAKIIPEARRGLLKKILAEQGFVRAMEAHNGMSAIIANNAVTPKNKHSFDALWISSFTESAAKGQPDIEIMGPESRLHTIRQVLEVTNKPIIVDGDTGGDPNAFEYFLRTAEDLGVSAVVIEDKMFPKRNSMDTESLQMLADPISFAHKIRRGKKALLTNHMMVIARIESFIAGKDLEDAIMRAEEYLKAGADGIMIHSKSKDPHEVLSFANEYKKLCERLGIQKPLVAVPNTYVNITASELKSAGFNIVIHANQLLRASVKAMQHVCRMILENERSEEAETLCSPVSEVFDLVGFSDIKNREKTL